MSIGSRLAGMLLCALSSGCASGDGDVLGQASASEHVNQLCPMGNERVVKSGGSSEWRGMNVGFCCAMCQPLFEQLSDAEKINAMTRVDVVVP